jgi:GxxExxY protein
MSVLLLQESTTRRIVGSFYDVYNRLGFGFLESVYANALELELNEHGLLVRREMPVRVHYRGRPVGEFRADMVVEDVVLVEIKASRVLDPHAREQTLNYLRGTALEVGLILHFGTRPRFERVISSCRDPRRSVGLPAANGGIRADPRPSGPRAEELDRGA